MSEAGSCVECGGALPPYSGKGPHALKFCSRKCGGRHWSRQAYAKIQPPGVEKQFTCKQCATQFSRTYGSGTPQGKRTAYCSQECAKLSDIERGVLSDNKRWQLRTLALCCAECDEPFSVTMGAGTGRGAKRSKCCSVECKKARHDRLNRGYKANRDRDLERAQTLKRQYDLGASEYAEMLRVQAGICPLCLEIMSPPCVDHDHATGRVRGLLCHQCNLGIGNLRDDPLILERAIWYVSDGGVLAA